MIPRGSDVANALLAGQAAEVATFKISEEELIHNTSPEGRTSLLVAKFFIGFHVHERSLWPCRSHQMDAQHA